MTPYPLSYFFENPEHFGEGWLCLKAPQSEWSYETPAMVLCSEDEDVDEQTWIEIVEVHELVSILQITRDALSNPTQADYFESLLYYVENDAFLHLA